MEGRAGSGRVEGSDLVGGENGIFDSCRRCGEHENLCAEAMFPYRRHRERGRRLGGYIRKRDPGDLAQKNDAL